MRRRGSRSSWIAWRATEKAPGDRRLRGDDGGRGGQHHHQRQQRLRHQRVHGRCGAAAQSQQQRALAKVVEHQRRPDQREPGHAHRLLAEMTHVRIQRLAAGHRQEHAADDGQRDRGVAAAA